MSKKILSALLALVLITTLLVGCKKEPESVFSLCGEAIESYIVVAEKKSLSIAESLASSLNEKLGVTLAVVEKNAFDGNGNAIMIGDYESNNYGGYRYSLLNKQVGEHRRIYLDCDSNDQVRGAVQMLLHLFTGEVLAAKSLDLPEKSFGYLFGQGEASGELTLLKEKQSELCAGVRYIEQSWKTLEDGTFKSYALVLSPEAVKGLSLAAPPLGQVEKTSVQMANAQTAGKKVVAATNAGFFYKSAGTNLPYGACIVDGEVLSTPHKGEKNSYLWFGVTDEGKAVFGNVDNYNSTYKDHLWMAVSGSRFIFKNGVPFELSEGTGRDPMTQIAICADGSVIILCADGRDAGGSCGTNAADTARIMMELDLDVQDILNLDGGGSTTVVVAENGKNVVKNMPSDKGGERAVQSVLLITVP